MNLIPTSFLLFCAIFIRCESHQKTFKQSGKRDDKFLFAPQNTFTSQIKTYLALCAVIKNEPDIREWVVYHHRMGVGTFYIHDNGDQYLLKDEVSDFIEKGIVHPVQGNFTQFPQMVFYRYCIKEYRKSHNWIATIDADEFIVTKKQCSIPSILRYYEEYGGVSLNWMLFGSSGHVTRPSGGILSNYFTCNQDEHVKTIANTKYTTRPNGPHSFHYTHDKHSVDTEFRKVIGSLNSFRPSLYEIMWVNHYHLKSREDFEKIRKRGQGDRPGLRPKYTDDKYFERRDRLMKKNCSIVIMPLTLAADCSKEMIFPSYSSI